MADNGWMYSGRTSAVDRTDEWTWKTAMVVQEIARGPKTLDPRCPCVRCRNRHRARKEVMKQHLWAYGYMSGFVTTVEFTKNECDRVDVMRQRIDGIEYDGMRNLLEDFRDAMPESTPCAEPEGPSEPEQPPEPQDPEPSAKAFYDMMESAKRPLYPGANVSQLDTISQLLATKLQFNTTRSCFEASLVKHGNTLPEGHCLPKTWHECKKIMRALSMDYIKIDCCPKGCLLFWKQFADDKYCSLCGASRYLESKGADGEAKVQTKVPASILRYLPFIKRIQRLYMTLESAKQMTWHKDGKRYPDEHGRETMGHPSDGRAWKKFDEDHPDLAAEARHCRVAVSLDGFNPYGMSSSSYSCWPVFVIPLNLPPPALMQRNTIFLTLIIPGPDYPGKNLSVYLQPLVDDLNHSWHHPTLTYDRASRTNFFMKVWYQYSMHDMPGYALFCGHCTAGKWPCPVCRQLLEFLWLKAGKKYSAFDKHRPFLKRDHPFRHDIRNFKKGKVVLEERQIPTFDGAAVKAELAALVRTESGVPVFDGYGKEHNWTHEAAITKLDYYHELALPHNIGVMHTEKNVVESLFNTILNISEKTKDNVKARVDVKELCNRPRQHMQPPEGRRKGWLKPHSQFVLDKDQKKEAFTWLKNVMMFPYGYCSNMSKGVNIEKGKVTGMKSHDYHIWIERLMPVMLRGYLPEHIWRVLAELSHFFRTVCAKQICPLMIEKLHDLVPELLCKLEKIFPPGFFTPMLHLIVHLANEALLGGPVQFRWQFCIEREFKYIRLKCGNKNKIEACIAEATILQEIANATTAYYADEVPSMHNQVPRYNVDEPKRDPKLLLFKFPSGKAGGAKPHTLSNQEKECIMLYVLMNMGEVVDDQKKKSGEEEEVVPSYLR